MKKIISLLILVSITFSSVFAVTFKNSAFRLNDSIVFEGIEEIKNPIPLTQMEYRKDIIKARQNNISKKESAPASTTGTEDDLTATISEAIVFVGNFFGLAASIYNSDSVDSVIQKDDKGRIHNRAEDNLFRD